jgi:methyl-accepting chemotaxis protein
MKNWKISTRMALGFGLVLALMMLSSGLGLVKFRAIGGLSGDMVERSVPMERAARDWLAGTSTNLARTIAMTKTDDVALQVYLQKEIAASSVQISEYQKKLEGLIDSPQEKTLMAQLNATRAKYLDTRKSIMKLKAEGKAAEAAKLVEEQLVPQVAVYEGELREMLKLQVDETNASGSSIAEMYGQGQTALLGLGAVAVILGVGIAWALSRSITRPLGAAVRIAEAVASGDLSVTVKVESRDETGLLMAALRDMSADLAKVVAQVRDGTDAIATASGQIAAGNADLSQRTEEQAASLEETASSMEELTSTVKQNADNARQANQMAAGAAAVAVKGGQVVSQVVSTMSSINDSSKKIVDIISVIDSIAFQTNILALNAAVEAARAGEQGRGFAVVASEVRSLAQRSATAAKEIKGLITDSVGKVEDGTRLVGEAGKTMDEIVTSVKRVTDIMAEIAAASQEQSSGIEQVNQAITQMDQVTQQNAALVEEAAAAAESLQEQAQSLTQAVSVFKVAQGEVRVAGETPAPLHTATVTALKRRKPIALERPVRTESKTRPRKVANAKGDEPEWQEF